MNNQVVTILFPGQGAYYKGVLDESRDTYHAVEEVFAEVDSVAAAHIGRSVSPAVFGKDSPNGERMLAEAPDILQLAIFATSVAMYEILKSRGMHASVLVGHSFGELAALVCGGAFSIKDGAEIVCHRVSALKLLAGNPGYMAAMSVGLERAREIVRLVGEEKCAVAAINCSNQTVVSGTKTATDSLVQIAEALNISVKRLNSAHAFHCPSVMHPVAEEFARRTRRIKRDSLRIPVYSPILGRYYDDSDTLTECLADHLVTPVCFSHAIQYLYDRGSRVFVECGALGTLSKLVKNILRNPDVTTIPCLDPSRNGRSMETAFELLSKVRAIPGFTEKNLREQLLPEASAAEFNAFWSEHGPRFIKELREQFAETRDSAAEEPSQRADVEVSTAKSSDSPQTPTGRDELLYELITLYADVLEYPREVFTEDVDLEGELGVDSVKQMELLTRISEKYHMPPLPEGFEFGNYSTLGKVTDLVHGTLSLKLET